MPEQRESSTSAGEPITLLAVGDISPNRDDPPSIFRFCGDVFRKADIAFGQMEAPLSDRGTPLFNIATGPARLYAKNISAVTEEGAGFDVMSFAANHALDHGYEAFFDTIEALTKHGILVVGAGKDITEASRPAILERKGTKVGFLAYCSVLPMGYDAKDNRPGVNLLKADTYYKQLVFTPGAPPLVVTQLVPEYRATMEEAIEKLRPQVDVLVVYIHAGVDGTGGVSTMIAMYQKEAAHAAIDAGADLVLQSHAHKLKGIEVYKGKVVFYGNSDFAVEHRLGYPGQPGDDAGLDRKRREQAKEVNLDPDDALYRRMHRGLTHADHPKTVIVKVYIQNKKVQQVTCTPAWISPNEEPEVLKRQDPRAQEVFDYMKRISEEEDLKVRFSWEGEEVLVGAP